MTTTIRVIPVVVDHNRHDDTFQCLSSLRAAIRPEEPIVVVDNGSTEPLQLAGMAAIHLIRETENGGFARGFNTGIRHALALGAEAVLVLNNDTIVERQLLTELTAEMKPGVGITAPRIYFADAPFRIWSDGFRANPLTLEMRLGRRDQIDAGTDDEPRAVDYVTGCAMLIHRSVFESIGYFDERFFAYYEDLDFCVRARRAGFGIVNVPRARLWHKVASTTGLETPRRQYLLAYGSVLYFARHAGWRWPFVIAARSASTLKLVIGALSRQRGDLIAAHLRGLVEGCRDAR
jgi:GT2 family glycosyltransferase